MSSTSASTLGLFTFFSAGLFNLFVPSGGGQWAVQGPLVMTAAAENGGSVSADVELGRPMDEFVSTLLGPPLWELPGRERVIF